MLTPRRNPDPRPVFRTFRMRRSLPILLAAAALLAAAGPAAAQSTVSTPTARTLYKTGPTGRFLMDGEWLFKLDNRSSGPQLETGSAGWKAVTVPNAWNAGDDSPQSFAGRRRLVPQGLPPAQPGEGRRPGSSASSRSTTARRCG